LFTNSFFFALVDRFSKEEGAMARTTDEELRERTLNAQIAIERQLGELSAELASLSIDFVRQSKTKNLAVIGKRAKLTALTEQISVLLALIEFIDSLNLKTSNNRSKNIRDELVRRHSGIVRQLEQSAATVASRATNLIMTSLQSWNKESIVPLGAKARKLMAGDHARLIKDLAILGFIQQFEVVSRSTRKHDL